jgi:hypothetical protein
MRKLKLFLDAKAANTPPRGISKASRIIFSVLTLLLLSVGNVWAAEELKATIDFSSNDFSIPTSKTVAENTYTHDGISMTLTGTSGNGYAYYSKDKYLLNGKQGATITFSAFEWKTTKIVVTGRSGASTSTKMNIFVGENAVSTETVGSVGTNTYNIASASQAAGTIYTLKVTSAHNAQFTKFEIYGESSDTPAKTLQTVAVSGTPTQTSYTAGEDFDPAGLTVTGHYSDNTDAPITSGITWAYDPSQTLSLNQTSIGVTATVDEISSPKFNVTGLTVTEAPAADSYELVTNVADLAEGDKIIIVNASATKAISTTQNSNNRGAADVTATNDVIIPGDAVQILTLGKSGDNWTLYTGEGYLYASSGSSNQMKTQTTLNDNGKWAITISMNVATFVAQGSNSRNVMQYNAGSTIFACYASASQTDLKIYKKVEGTVKPSAELAYAEADQKNLIKFGDAFTAPTLVNPHTVAVTYASSDDNIVAVNETTGAVTIKAAGFAEITASFAGNDDYKAGSASYTIGVTAHAGTQADPYTVADAKIVIDAIETEENVHVAGKVSQIVTAFNSTYGNISFNISEDGTTANQLEAFRCKSFGGDAFTSENDVETGATVVVKGILKKYNSKYELDEGCCLVTYEAPEAPKTPIANTQETAYSVAQALIYAADGLAYDLNDEVFVQGKVAVASSSLFNNKYLTYFISDNGVNENTLKIYNGLDINGVSFTSKDDVKVGDIVIVKGKLLEYNSVLELNQNNELVLHKPVATISVENMEIAVGDEPKAIVAEIIPAVAADHVVYSIAEGGDAFISIDAENKISAIAEGVATINVTLADGDTYAGTNASFTVTVNAAAAPVLTDYYEKVTETAGIVEGTYLIVYEGESVAFDGGLDDSDNDHKLDKASNTIVVDITSDYKIGVTSATEAATFYIDPAAGTIQSASGKYIGVTSNSNGLKTSDDATTYNNAFAIDNDGNAVISAVFSESTMTMRYNKGSGQERFRYYASGQQPIALYKLANEVTKLNPELAWDKESIELTVGGVFTSPGLSHAQGITGTISYVSDNENVATVENGVISLVAEATGTAHITASYAGDDTYKSGSAVCTIKVNPAHSIYVSPSLTVNFGSVAKDASVDDQVITVTLTEVPNATATLGGSGASAFSITPAALTASGDITISVASTATAGTFNATLTISDDASEAESKVVNLKIIVTDPASEETAISTSTQWVAAVAADLVDGKEVLITGIKDEVVYAMGEQKSTNRAAYVASVDGEGVLTPGEGTMSFTLVAQATEGVFALRTSNGKYLYAAASGSNHLKTQDEVDVNAKWTLTVASAVAEGSSNRNVMQFNGSGTNKLFSCYSSDSQEDIQFYVPKPADPEPQPEVIRDGLEAGKWGTICPSHEIQNPAGASFYTLTYADKNGDVPAAVYFDEIAENASLEAGKPYLFIADGAAIIGTKNGEATSVLQNYNGFTGVLAEDHRLYVDANDAAAHKYYIIKGNKVQLCGEGFFTVPAERAYIDMSVVSTNPTSQAPGRRRVCLTNAEAQVATGFENIEASEKPMKLMIDGQIYILRGEKLFDTTGRLVK